MNLISPSNQNYSWDYNEGPRDFSIYFIVIGVKKTVRWARKATSSVISWFLSHRASGSVLAPIWHKESVPVCHMTIYRGSSSTCRHEDKYIMGCEDANCYEYKHNLSNWTMSHESRWKKQRNLCGRNDS